MSLGKTGHLKLTVTLTIEDLKMSEANFNMDEVRGTIISGLQNGATDDEIRLEMFKLAVPFNKINSIFKEVAIEEGFRADPKVIREAIAAELDETSVEFDNWERS